ncbi:hypothetical protein [Pedococcus sp. 5OH_020]|uniref:hypothetical protein n=1 Tax=Pedococcus sp. 5OH_020 TaxID=2989814 RepID=UPI0022E9E419|nr:hypothetical protein [Pedococcus sp. 5OH_020]
MPPQQTERLATAMRSLYAASPEDFMAIRKQAVADARAAKDTEAAGAIGKLRKPSVAAWAVNLVVRRAPQVVEDLLDLGRRMRGAQAMLDTRTLTALRPDRDRLVSAFVEAAARELEADGRTLSAAGRDEVRATVIAALADGDAATAVASGQLTRALSYSGFGEVDLSEAVFRTTSGAILTVVRGGTGDRGQATPGKGEPGAASVTEPDADSPPDTDSEAYHAAEQAERVAAARAVLNAATAELEKAEATVEEARQHAQETRERLALVERQLEKARAADGRALEDVSEAVGRRKAAVAARQAAKDELDRLTTLRQGRR